jgi:SAM-dependent methyltransferase
MTDDPLGQIERSWHANARAWTEAVREGRIASRRLATDEAIVEAVMAHAPRRVLDLGCGEGWLARALAARGVEAVGVDASAPLVEAARRAGGGVFHVCGYDGLAEAGPARFGGPFDVVAANFALLSDPLDDALAGARGLLAASGVLVIQTVHPWAARGDAPYRDGWRVERFAGFGDGFAEPMPWFFRTLQSWFATLARAGFRVDDVREPAHPDTGEPLSLILAARPGTPETMEGRWMESGR